MFAMTHNEIAHALAAKRFSFAETLSLIRDHIKRSHIVSK
jgi:hypothetical protein